jgi:uncharacterized membrane protein YbhN (UPF0104 family)
VIEALVFVLIGIWAAPLLWPKLPSVILFLILPFVFFLRVHWIKAIGFTVISDLTDAAMIGCCLLALGIEFGPLQWCAVLIAINLAILIPSPGNLGTLEVGAVFGLHALGVDKTSALAFTILYRAAHTLPISIAYVFILSTKRKNRFFSNHKKVSVHAEEFFVRRI